MVCISWSKFSSRGELVVVTDSLYNYSLVMILADLRGVTNDEVPELGKRGLDRCNTRSVPPLLNLMHLGKRYAFIIKILLSVLRKA